MQARRYLSVLAMIVMPVLAAGAPVQAAQPYPAPPPTLTVSAATVTVGDSVTLTGTGFGQNENVTVDVTTEPLAAGRGPAVHRGDLVPVAFTLPQQMALVITTDANGSFQTTVQLTQVGIAVITATGQTSGLSASVRVTVLASGLPVTGSSGRVLAMVAAAGVAALVAGTLLMAFAVRRRRARA